MTINNKKYGIMDELRSMKQIEAERRDFLQQLGLDQPPSSYRFNNNAIELRRHAAYHFKETIETMHQQNAFFSEPYPAMVSLVLGVEYSEPDATSMLRTYYTITKAAYAHQAAYINSQAYLREFKRLYEKASVSEHVYQRIRHKELQQLERDTLYLQKKMHVSALDIKYGKQRYEAYLEQQANNATTTPSSSPSSHTSPSSKELLLLDDEALNELV